MVSIDCMSSVVWSVWSGSQPGCVVWLVLAWLSGSALVSINVVTLHRARLLLGWVTICGRVNHLGM